METARSEMGITVIDDRFIRIFGGFNDDDLDSIEIFDVEKNEWSTSSIKLTSPMSGMKVITVDHKIFIIGFQQVEVLDVDKMKWSKVPVLNRYITVFILQLVSKIKNKTKKTNFIFQFL